LYRKYTVPLTDKDREPWLQRIAQQIEILREFNVVLACSALKAMYRRQLDNRTCEVHWVYLQGCRELLLNRISQRQNHFMSNRLLESQLDTLEEPDRNKALWVNIDPSPEEIASTIENWLHQQS